MLLTIFFFYGIIKIRKKLLPKTKGGLIMTIKSGAPLITLLASLFAIFINAIKCSIVLSVIYAILYCTTNFTLTLRKFFIIVIILTLIVSAIPPRKSKEIIVKIC